MKELNEIHDDEIRIIGNVADGPACRRNWRIWGLSALFLILAALSVIIYITTRHTQSEPEVAFFEPEESPKPTSQQWIGSIVDSLERCYTEIRDTVMNDIPMRLYIPHNATMELHVGKMNKADSSVVYVVQAADVRADNGGIVGAFVLKDEPLAWGFPKKVIAPQLKEMYTSE